LILKVLYPSLGDPLDAFLIPEEHSNWFIVVHDPVGVRGTLPASSRAEEAGFTRLVSAEEACKGSRTDLWSFSHDERRARGRGS
jgi:hypothetical protein